MPQAAGPSASFTRGDDSEGVNLFFAIPLSNPSVSITQLMRPTYFISMRPVALSRPKVKPRKPAVSSSFYKYTPCSRNCISKS